ncbi:FMN-binding protein [Aquabacterium parvum]|jgi:Na+-translocating ferredoxin:NAD+ oxidoreductase RnfG subunit|uniref:FMN-binding protein n=1 Tax=Aquabacterium parvum TaxID=70584 RepID=UPI000718FF65|nr:FMN-binding protein [Aquabacterium parvum]MBU0917031.1 FMN-binding protein [Gammaproteobacteria bacterium]
MSTTRDWSAFLLPVAALAVAAPPTHAMSYLSVAQAQAALFPSAKVFAEASLKFDDAQKDRIKAASGLRQRWDAQRVWRAERDGQLQGWFIVDDVIGKHDFITYAVAISPDGRVLGVEVMEYRETHGGQIREATWRRHLVGKNLSDPFKLDEDVPNITGATLSCRNVMDGVKRLLAIHKLFLVKA